MKRVFSVAVIASTLIFHAAAQTKDLVAMTNHFVVGNTNELSTKDLQDILQIKSWNFDVHLAGETNGVTVSLEIKKEGEKAQTVFKEILDSGKLNANGKVGTNLNIVLAISPAGPDGTGIYDTKQLRVFFKLRSGTSGLGLIPNPFFKFRGGIEFWPSGVYPNSAGDAVLAQGNIVDGTLKQKVQLVVHFNQF
jgi:hypothetical protein